MHAVRGLLKISLIYTLLIFGSLLSFSKCCRRESADEPPDGAPHPPGYDLRPGAWRALIHPGINLHMHK